LIFSLNYSDADFDEVVARFVNAARAMERDGWFWCDPKATNRKVKRHILKEMIAQRIPALRAGT
jgi:glutamate-1-semialdehyde 2,1-aminomutase